MDIEAIELWRFVIRMLKGILNKMDAYFERKEKLHKEQLK